MSRPDYHQLELQREGDIFVLRFKQHHFDEPAILELGRELAHLVNNEGCRRMVLSLGKVDALFSRLIEALIRVNRSLGEQGGIMKLCDVTPEVMSVFEACNLRNYFEFQPDVATAVTSFRSSKNQIC